MRWDAKELDEILGRAVSEGRSEERWGAADMDEER
jgi:hypothetical protein